MVVEQKFLLWIAAAMAAFVVYRLVFRAKEPAVASYEREIEEILSSDKYKVKGRFED
ncbi:TPA: hypothetical protein HA231_04315 [Candidatus Woesearchaeota archaeon]|nr:hypothetical protein [Candidatus Woesearchaeota archaeon]